MFLGMATQGERRAETRQRLLDAAADLFATRGIESSSVDAIAERADRTSGAIYDHFGGKEGILFALLEGWVDDVAAVITAELVAADTLDDRLAALWRNITHPPAGDDRWIRLEHELWSYAARDDRARAAPGPPLRGGVGERRRGGRRVGGRRRPPRPGPAQRVRR